LSGYVVRRIVALVPIVLLVSLIVFAVFQILPGNVADVLAGQEGAGDPVIKAQLRKELGLDKSAPERYLIWLEGLAHGDLGKSPVLRQPVTRAIRDRFRPTLELAVAAGLIALLVALPSGVLSAVKRGTWIDAAATFVAVGGVAMPSFWMGILLVLVFAVDLRWLPSSGYIPFTDDPGSALKHLALPAITLGLHLSASPCRQIRSSMLEVLSQDYVRTARAKGLTGYRVIMRHALRNALLPVLTIAGVQVGLLLGGVVVIEQVFAIPGMGRLAVDSIFARDYLTVQGIVLIMGTLVLLVNLATDLLYAYVDPRIHY
jgi:peptide/nickel transport system permease protein